MNQNLTEKKSVQEILERKVDRIKTELSLLSQELSLHSELALLKPELFTSNPKHYRMRAEFRVWHEGDCIYYFMNDPATHEKILLTQFSLASKIINESMELLLMHIKDVEVLKRKLFQVDFLSTQSGQLLITLLYHRKLDNDWEVATRILKEKLKTVFPNIDFIGRSRKQKLVIDRDFVFEELLVHGSILKYQQMENSFTQPNAQINQMMLEWAQNVLGINLVSDLLELYCGNGNFTLALAKNFRKVLATEISKTSVDSAHLNLKINNIENVTIVRMSAEDFTDALNKVRPFNRLRGIDLNSFVFETILVDPPRAGLDPLTLNLVSRFKRILYISCSPTTLFLNLRTLLLTHKIEKMAVFDQFPSTDHIECGVLLVARS